MKFNVKNDSHRSRALSAAAGGMVIVPPNSEDVYDLDTSAQFKSGSDLAITNIMPTAEAIRTQPVTLQAQLTPQTAPPKANAPKPAHTLPTQPPQATLPANEPAPWQRGLEAPK